MITSLQFQLLFHEWDSWGLKLQCDHTHLMRTLVCCYPGLVDLDMKHWADCKRQVTYNSYHSQAYIKKIFFFNTKLEESLVPNYFKNARIHTVTSVLLRSFSINPGTIDILFMVINHTGALGIIIILYKIILLKLKICCLLKKKTHRKRRVIFII